MEFYRYDIVTYANMSDDNQHNLPLSICNLLNTRLVLTTMQLHKETPKGYWIGFGSADLRSECRWVSKTSKKRYAYPTKEEALHGFLHSKRKQKKIMESQLKIIDYGIHEAEVLLNKLNI